MWKTNNKAAFGAMKKISMIFFGSITLILLCFIGLNATTARKEHEDKLLINIFGKQRMYTQMMSKETNRIYTRLEVLKSSKAYRATGNDIQISKLRYNLTKARDSFSRYFEVGKRRRRLQQMIIKIKITKTIDQSSSLEELEQISGAV